MEHLDDRDELAEFKRRVQSLETEDRGTNITLTGAIVRGKGGLQVAPGGSIDIPYTGTLQSVEDLIWARQQEAAAAKSSADAAWNRAGGAQSTADAARSEAADARSRADAAQSSASAAQSSANSAASSAASARSQAVDVQNQLIKLANYLRSKDPNVPNIP